MRDLIEYQFGTGTSSKHAAEGQPNTWNCLNPANTADRSRTASHAEGNRGKVLLPTVKTLESDAAYSCSRASQRVQTGAICSKSGALCRMRPVHNGYREVMVSTTACERKLAAGVYH